MQFSVRQAACHELALRNWVERITARMDQTHWRLDIAHPVHKIIICIHFPDGDGMFGRRRLDLHVCKAIDLFAVGPRYE